MTIDTNIEDRNEIWIKNAINYRELKQLILESKIHEKKERGRPKIEVLNEVGC